MFRQHRRKNNPSTSQGIRIQLKQCETNICHKLTHASKILWLENIILRLCSIDYLYRYNGVYLSICKIFKQKMVHDHFNTFLCKYCLGTLQICLKRIVRVYIIPIGITSFSLSFASFFFSYKKMPKGESVLCYGKCSS